MIVIMHISTWGPEEAMLLQGGCGLLGLRPSLHQYRLTQRDLGENSGLLFTCKTPSLEIPNFMLEILQPVKNDLKKSMESIAALASASSLTVR